EFYLVYRSGSPDGDFTLVDTSADSIFFDTTSLAGLNYYKIAAVNVDTSSLSEVSEGFRQPYPSSPASITASAGTDSAAVTILWKKTEGTSGYRLYRSTSDTFTANVQLRATVTDTFFIDTVPSDSFYYYKIKAFNQGGESPLSTLTARGYRIPTVLPVTPTDLDTLYSANRVHLVWSTP
ncbi:MAG: fibronectin type III domain-containing protein, partial [Dehalococcoidia bacterium]